MNRPSKKIIHWSLIGIAVLLVWLTTMTTQRTIQKRKMFKSGRFEQQYTSAIESLHDCTKTVRNKLHANMPGDLDILPEELLRRSQTGTSETTGEPTLENIRLRGIYWSDTLPLAEINNRLYKIGEQIEGFTLKKIQPYQIVLSDSTGSTQTVSLVKNF